MWNAREVAQWAVLAGACSLVIAGAAKADSGLELDLEFGAEYNDNVTIDSIDSTSRQGDSLLRISGAIGAQVFEKGDTSFSGRYSFFQSIYQDLSNFDLQIHGLSARLKSKVGKVNVGGSYRYDHIRLDGAAFLDVHSVGPDIGLLVAKKTYLTASYQFRQQTFADPLRSERNADRHSADAKVYFLLGDGKNITTGYRISRQTAEIDSLSYWGHSFDAGYKHPFKLGSKEATFRLRYQYRQRDYSGFDAAIGDERQDKRHTARVSLEVPLTERLELGAEYKYVSSISNLPVADYTGNSVRASLSWSF
ncbi:outer membrane beta-barrel protein [Kordiimonas lipolytica]|uniref:Outer membrane beta-barrel protein n=1 Tax=Kordiimonas lipolytica TaxID=1662421 RepID=A0ABV8UAD3_9PROT|nr:outer membrane beta-barrel protein [Kordiimonas lipolytica]